MKDHRTRTAYIDVEQGEGAAIPRKRKRLSREERAAEARQAIFAAASKVVGQHGYADASITRITEAAGIAQGTFYLYFDSRQALFDELLPHVGQDMLRLIHDRVTGAMDIYDVEERGFRAFFQYLKENPGFFRILNEAEIAAPVAHSKHFKVLTDRYVESLERARNAGQVKRFDRDELETLAYVFMAARSYLYLRYVKGKSTARSLPEKVIQTYMKLVRDGLK
ncbi:TetR/AcrR family transcriptional regulator [Bradyrhizobium sp. C-145]|uniref:TetR/AcrR family transcriptional regulator n=1 Tax=Bradyrhizobium sp. C-145 TaxID=574727 RepID=UPI00201B835E|nr:TetR/AcrR family transcriptional regulator [Bradyrhizobium sp. C-145]UQR61446.1 TetR/AcrR family transcriptional regulator [Bradyrhizobium sp. C-145]